MSLHLDFEPHSWYMGFAVEDNRDSHKSPADWYRGNRWFAYTADGMHNTVIELHSDTLEQLRHLIREYHLRGHDGYGERVARRRLEYLRGELRAERMSYGESNELIGLAEYIEDGDIELLEAAGVSEDAAEEYSR